MLVVYLMRMCSRRISSLLTRAISWFDTWHVGRTSISGSDLVSRGDNTRCQDRRHGRRRNNGSVSWLTRMHWLQRLQEKFFIATSHCIHLVHLDVATIITWCEKRNLFIVQSIKNLKFWGLATKNCYNKI